MNTSSKKYKDLSREELIDYIEGQVILVSGIVFDISESKAVEKKLKEANTILHRLSMTDELTSAFNRS